MCNGFSPQMKEGSLPEGGALPLPDRHVVHSFGEGGISAAHRHSCGYKEQQPERHDHEALPGQEEVPTDPHPCQSQLPRTPAAARSLSPALSEQPEVLWGESKEREREQARSWEREMERLSPGSPEPNNSSSAPASAFQPSRTRCPLLHPKKSFLDAPWGGGSPRGGRARKKEQGRRSQIVRSLPLSVKLL